MDYGLNSGLVSSRDSGLDNVAPHGAYTPANVLAVQIMQPRSTTCISDIGRPCYGHLASVNIKYRRLKQG